MTRDEWRAYVDSAPATPNQVGAIHREFSRLGFGPPTVRNGSGSPASSPGRTASSPPPRT